MKSIESEQLSTTICLLKAFFKTFTCFSLSSNDRLTGAPPKLSFNLPIKVIKHLSVKGVIKVSSITQIFLAIKTQPEQWTLSTEFYDKLSTYTSITIKEFIAID